MIREIASISCPEDGLRIDPESVEAREIRSAQEYEGVRVTLPASLAKAYFRLQVDVGFDDAITPAPETAEFPTLPPLPAPVLRTYPIETVIAEKFEAITRLGRANSRMKDFRELLTLARRSHFDGTILTHAARATFERRNAELRDLADLLDPEFFDDTALARRWQTYCRTNAFEDPVASSLPAVGAELRRFLEPLANTLHDGEPPTIWSPSAGWGDS